MALEQLTDHRHVTVFGRVALERRKDRFLGETQAVIRQDQHMPVALMFEVIVNAFFFAQPLQQCQIALLVLNAKRPDGIVSVGQFEAIALLGHIMFLQQLAQDHRYAEVMKDAA